jgi:predicted Zn-dependent peptidase
MVREPHLPEGEIANIQSVLLQDLDALQDNPARRAMVELTSRYYPSPFNRSSLGEMEGIKKTDRATCQGIVKRSFGPQSAILSIAGRVKVAEALEIAEKHFGGWKGGGTTIPEFGPLPPTAYFHIPFESSQVQIALASPSVKFGEPDYYSGKIAISLLGASMFGRLFVEVREKRGLCYSVYARHGATTSYGTVSAYVGTTPERAQESLDVLVREFTNLKGTVSQDELDRARTNLKAALVMGEESPGSRAASNAGDWWLLRRVRPLREINDLIDAVTLESVDSYLTKYPFAPCSILTLGKRELELPIGLVSRSCNGD